MAEGQIGKGRNTVVSVKASANAVTGQKRKGAPEEAEKADAGGGKDKKNNRRGKKVKR
jgi:hypothetical protein